MARTMRAMDAAEITSWGLCVRHTLHFLWRDSPVRRAALVDGEVAAVWGVQSALLGDDGQPWLFTAPAIEKAKLAFLRETRREINDLLGQYRRLRCYVLASYSESVRFFEAMGFAIGSPEPVGKDGVPYRLMTITRKTATPSLVREGRLSDTSRYAIVPATPDHIGRLYRNLPAAAARVAERGGNLRSWLRAQINLSSEAWVALVDGDPLLIWGYIPTSEGPELWANFSDVIRRYPLTIVREARREMARAGAVHGKIVASDRRAWRFAEFLGFTVWQDEPMNDSGVTCYPITLAKL